jgi:acetoin utilization deacetylase AcuC-like enzyme
MTTLLYAHPSFAAHETPRGHPEHGGRVQAIEKALEADEFATLVRREAPKASPRALERVHPKKHVDAIVAVAPREGLVQLDPDTFMGPTSLEAALRAAGAGVAAVDAIFAGEATNAFVACRPPGHHATPDRAMGFCLFNNVAVAAMHARAAHGARRIAVVDFDVHHGNGTEVAFWHDEGAFFASSHQWPQYPGTGRESDRGAYDNIVNAPLPGGSGSEAFRKAWSERLLPALAEFRPDFIGVSAGFDAHRADPIGGLALVEDDYAWVTAEIVSVARSACRSRLVSFLEGGYDLAALAASGAAHVRVLMAA